MDLRMRLRNETMSLHSKIEQTLLFRKILEKEISQSDYQELIKKLYGFIAPCEDLIESGKFELIFDKRKKRPWLEQDLHALNISNLNEAKLPRCKNLLDLSEQEYVLGYMYVMEGAMLGAQIIAPMLKAQLHITQDNGGRYFYGYGDETKIMWNDFCLSLQNINNIAQQNKIIESASNTFNGLYKWMEAGISLNENAI